MKFCYIVSIPHLQQYATKSDMHLTLVHLFEKYDKYTKFYVKRRALGDYVILDNSCFELGESVSIERIIAVIEYLNPQEVVSPEISDNIEEYRKLISEFRDRLNKVYYVGLVQAVLKGRTKEELIKCYHMLVNHPAVDVIGLPIEMVKICSRTSFLIDLLKIDDKLVFKKYHHFLGLLDPVELNLCTDNHFRGLIRSCDSSIPFWQGVYGVRIYKHYGLFYKKISDKVDFEYKIVFKKQHKIIKHNIKVIERFIR